jgi:glycosyltransferase involved in cell wall biosynthesis
VVPVGARLATEPAGARDTDRGAEPRPFTIGYAGHLYPWKGVDLVVEAIAALLDTEGLIIGGHQGEADLTRVKALVDRLHCSSRVTFTGHLPPHEALRRLRDAQVLTLPNPSSAIARDFTSPLKLFEYMAAGRPIVASDLPSIREVLRDGDNAILVEPGNPHALTEGIRRIKNDPALGETLAGRALQDVRAYTWDARAGRLETLFRQVAG